MFLACNICVSPFLRSSDVLTKDADSVDSVRPIHCSTSDRRIVRTPTFSPHSSFTLTHRSIGCNPQTLTESDRRLIHLRVYDSRHNSRQSEPSPSWTQVLWFLEYLVKTTVSCSVTTRTRITVCLPTQPSVCEVF